MNTTDYIKMSLEMSNNWIMGLATDAADIAMTAPTPNGGNHPLWCVGHLAYSQANLLSMATGHPNALAEWEGIFKFGTSVSADASMYPPFDEVMSKYNETHTHILEYINGLSDGDLDKPSQAEGEMKEWFGTIAQCMAAMPVHIGFHGGQIADARRAAGREPVMG